jgi:hypothetical protein
LFHTSSAAVLDLDKEAAHVDDGKVGLGASALAMLSGSDNTEGAKIDRYDGAEVEDDEGFTAGMTSGYDSQLADRYAIELLSYWTLKLLSHRHQRKYHVSRSYFIRSGSYCNKTRHVCCYPKSSKGLHIHTAGWISMRGQRQ